MPSPELDRKVAALVGLVACGHDGCGPNNGPDCYHDTRDRYRDVKNFHPSDNLAQAMWAADRVSLMPVLPDRGSAMSIYGFALVRESRYDWSAAFGINTGTGRTAQEAICHAIVKTLDGLV